MRQLVYQMVAKFTEVRVEVSFCYHLGEYNFILNHCHVNKCFITLFSIYSAKWYKIYDYIVQQEV